jgi:hypothetical protein
MTDTRAKPEVPPKAVAVVNHPRGAVHTRDCLIKKSKSQELYDAAISRSSDSTKEK